jgi:hypothetical protein
MLGAVILINTLHIGNKRGAPNIRNKYNYLKNAFKNTSERSCQRFVRHVTADNIACNGNTASLHKRAAQGFNPLLEEVESISVKVEFIEENVHRKSADKGGEINEKSERNSDAENNGNSGNNADKPFTAMLFDPFIELGLLLLGNLKTEHIGALGNGREGKHHRFDKINDTADKGPFEYLYLVRDRGISLTGNNDFFIIQSSHGNSGMKLAFHHNAFDYSLTADGTATLCEAGVVIDGSGAGIDLFFFAHFMFLYG